MTDIEIKRKELETAKRIRAGGYSCLIACVSCIRDHCPGKNSGATECYHWRDRDWDAFIATREAELAELDKAQKPEPLYPRAKGATGPTLDDFALALIQGGYYRSGETAAMARLYDLAAELKAESDRRRGI